MKKNILRSKFFITTPIYYINSVPHIGHTYTTVIADVLARYYRLKNKKIFFLTGTDEHGQKIEKTAETLNLSPLQLCDRNSLIFKEAWDELDISFNNFIRTTDSHHIKAVGEAIKYLWRKGFIYKSYYEGFYCIGCEEYKTISELVDRKCPIHNLRVEKVKEESYFFRLSQFKEIIKNKIKREELKIRPIERKNEILEFLKQGLQDVSISRKNVKWGIPLPFDKKQTLYVWVDALFNYLTGIGWKGNPKKLPKYWPPDLQLMSKDILRMHAILWPALLLSLKIPLPKKLFVHGYFTIEGQKMSKTLGNVISPFEMIKKFGKDATRYLLVSSCSYGKDSDVSWSKFQEKYNTELANGLGNLVSRICVLGEKVTKGKKIKIIIKNKNIQKLIKDSWRKYRLLMEEVKVSEALDVIFSMVNFSNKYIVEKKVWEESRDQLKYLKELVFILENISRMIEPFMPDISQKILSQLGRKNNFKDCIFRIKRKGVLFPRLN